MTTYTNDHIALAADAAHRALDTADEGWHYECLRPDDDGPKSCYKGHAARSMLVEEVMPDLLDALVKAGWTPPPAVQCAAETRSWDHFTPDQADSYWIRCTLAGPHGEHKDENTGLVWTDPATPHAGS